MIKSIFRFLFFPIASLAFVCLATQAASDSSAITTHGAWTRWLPGKLPAAGYMTLVNNSNQERFLIAASSPDYDHVSLHESYTMPSGESSMRMVAKLPIPAHGSAELKPGSYHLMLIGAHGKVKPGETVTVILELDGGETLTVVLPVKLAGKDG